MRSIKQMWSYVRKATKEQTQTKWLRKIYEKKIRMVKKTGKTRLVNYYKKQKHKVRAKVKLQRKYGGFKPRSYNIGTYADFRELVNFGKKTKNHLIIVEDTGTIIYEGSDIYNEVIQAKKELYGKVWKESLKQYDR